TKSVSQQAHFSEVKDFLYEPNAALMKSGLFDWISTEYNISKLHSNSHLYTSDKLIGFPGRRFKVTDSFLFSKKILTKRWGNKKAHVTTRNFKTSVEELRKKFKIKDGGDTYLFFTTNIENKLVVLVCTKA
ncbi:MAG: class I SAM-dependent methyltransferase, partial [Leeuwenhoekiella sp.]